MPQMKVMYIKEHTLVAPDIRRMVLDDSIYARPGQFVQISVSPTLDPFLRRPLSVHDDGEGGLVLLYRASGRGTRLLAEKKPGDSVDILGPLGNGFPVTDAPAAILVAGGIGVAPLCYLARTLCEAGKQVIFLFGAQKADQLYIPKAITPFLTVLETATDDGSAGHHGPVTEVLEQFLQKGAVPVYGCGPEGMLRAMVRVAAQYYAQTYVSLEARMACGVGACLGCVVETFQNSGEAYQRVCVDGPVFSGEEVFR
ncbi:MAG: dihydroorotate dehydrogenase electron transfer subunit [Clostridiales bacterium]|nr:dihydroorotate dehydrogenase electron transfer subunit [Clostridiales bacterium]